MAELDLGSVIGPQGPIGPKGDTGSQGSTGATGATGAKGDTGQRGSQWFNGTGITGTSTTATVFSGSGVTTALVGDYYLNTGTGADRGREYRCTVAGAATVAKWVYAGTILGSQGVQGIQGETGATGSKGDKGDKGDTGSTGPKGDKGDKGDTGATGPAGPNAANLISATDVQGLVGAAGDSSTVQLLINAIADKVANKLLLKTDVINQFMNDSSKAASAALAYSLKQTTDTLNSNLAFEYEEATYNGITWLTWIFKFKNFRIISSRAYVTVAVSTAWGSGIYASDPAAMNTAFPFAEEFNSMPLVYTEFNPDGTNAWTQIINKPTTRNAPSIQLLRGTSNASVSGFINLLVIGDIK